MYHAQQAKDSVPPLAIIKGGGKGQGRMHEEWQTGRQHVANTGLSLRCVYGHGPTLAHRSRPRSQVFMLYVDYQHV